MPELLTTENLRQFSKGFDLQLAFEINRADESEPINAGGDSWEVRIVKPRGGGMLIKTSGLTFEANTEAKISVPIAALDFDRSGIYYYQVIKTTSGAEVKSNVGEFEVLSSLPTGLPISPPTSPFEFGIPFFNSAGASVVSPAFLRYEDTANNEFFYVRGRKAVNAFKFEFDGWNGAAYTTGLYIKSTHASAYSPYHLTIENAAYSSKFHVSIGALRWHFVNELLESEYWFAGFYGNYIAMKLRTGNSSMASPRVQMISNGVSDVIAEFRAYAGQTGNIWEYRKSDNTLLSHLDKDGYGHFKRLIAEYLRNDGTDAGVVKFGTDSVGECFAAIPKRPAVITANQDPLDLGANRSLNIFLETDGLSGWRLRGLKFNTDPIDGETHFLTVTDNDGGEPLEIRHDSATIEKYGFITNSVGDTYAMEIGREFKIVYDASVLRWRVFPSYLF